MYYTGDEMETGRNDYTVTMLATEAGVERSYIARLCRQGKIPAYMVGNQYIISYNAAREWLANRARKLAEKS